MRRFFLHFYESSWIYRLGAAPHRPMDVREFLQSLMEGKLDFSLNAHGKKLSFFVSFGGDDIYIYGLRDVNEKIYDHLLRTYDGISRLNSNVFEKMDQDLITCDIYVLRASKSCAEIVPCEDDAKHAHDQVEQEQTSDDDKKFLAPSERVEQSKRELNPTQRKSMVNKVGQPIREVSQLFQEENAGHLPEDADPLSVIIPPVCVHDGSSAILETTDGGSGIPDGNIEKELLGKAALKCVTENIAFKEDPTITRSRRLSESDVCSPSNDEDQTQSVVCRSLPPTFSLKKAHFSGVKEKKHQLEKSEMVNSGLLPKNCSKDEADASSCLSADKYSVSSLTTEEDYAGMPSVATSDNESSSGIKIFQVSPDSSSCVGSKVFPTTNENCSSSYGAEKMNCLPAHQSVERLNVSEDAPSPIGESVICEELEKPENKNAPESKVPETSPLEETAAGLDTINKSLGNGGIFPSNESIPKGDNNFGQPGGINHGAQSNTAPSLSKPEKIPVKFVSDCNGSCRDGEVCPGNHQVQHSFEVEEMWAQISASSVVITLEKNDSKFNNIGFPLLHMLFDQENSVSVSTQDSTPLPGAVFPAPVDCVDDNNITRPLENIAAGQGSPSAGVLVPTRPQLELQLTDKAASALAVGKLAAGQPDACVGQLYEAVVQPQQQQQLSDLNYLPLQPGGVRHNANFAVKTDENGSGRSQEMERSHHVPVFPKFQGSPSDGNCEINKLSGGNCLVVKTQVDTINESNQEVDSVDTSIPGAHAEAAQVQMPYNLEHVDNSMEKKTDFEPVQYYRDKRVGEIIYSKPDSFPLMEGYFASVPTRQYKVLGEGGNGTVYEVLLHKEKYAAKWMVYRHKELNLWKDLNHPHLISLLAVAIGPQMESRSCFQFMRQMSGSIDSTIRPSRCLLEMTRFGYDLDTISLNALYMTECVLKALDYLAVKKLRHGDVKESNILYLLTCRCGDIWKCGCLKNEKYEVQLSDLDSVCEVEHSEDPRLLPNISCRAKTNEEWKCDTGTPGCHAPEQLLVPRSCSAYLHKTDRILCGSWCDVWSLGRTLVTLYLGKTGNAREFIKKANILLKQPDEKNNYSAKNEDVTSMVALQCLQASVAQHNSPSYRLVATVASKCMEIDFRDRCTASLLSEFIGSRT